MSKNKNELFNWYETAAMKKILPKEAPYPFEDTQIKVNSRILCCGTTGSGKTQALLHYISKSPNTFAKIIVFYKESEPLYELLKEKLKGSIEFHTSLDELPTLKEMRKDYDEDERILLVLDDYMMELTKYKNVNDYFIYGRRKGITLYLLAQSYYVVPKTIRAQLTYLLFFTMTQKKDINLILTEYDTEDKVLSKIYKDAISKPFSFLKIQTGKVEPNKRFSSGFADFYEIE